VSLLEELDMSLDNNIKMEANELRIGNFILLTKDNFYTSKIYQLSGFDICKLDESNCFDAKPIPLTEEWLLKFGIINRQIWVFEIFGDNKRGFHISSESGEWIFIEHVHQLQNLYFALTGEELIVDLQ
jgi:hypothetical protein